MIPKIKNEYKVIVNKKLSTIALNLADNQLAYIRSCKGPVEECKFLCNIYETKNSLNILFICCKFFTCKMQEDDDLLDDVNKVKALANHFACLEVSIQNEDIVIILLESLPPLYKSLITALEMMPTKELTMEYVTTRLMYKKSKMNEKEPQSNDATMMLRHGKWDNPFWGKDIKTYYHCDKPCYIACFCYKRKEKEKENVNNTKNDDNHAFVKQHETHSCTWIIDLG